MRPRRSIVNITLYSAELNNCAWRIARDGIVRPANYGVTVIVTTFDSTGALSQESKLYFKSEIQSCRPRKASATEPTANAKAARLKFEAASTKTTTNSKATARRPPRNAREVRGQRC